MNEPPGKRGEAIGGGDLEPIEAWHGVAILECTECHRKFMTSLGADGGLMYDGVRNHGRKYSHQRWDYDVLDRRPGRPSDRDLLREVADDLENDEPEPGRMTWTPMEEDAA